MKKHLRDEQNYYKIVMKIQIIFRLSHQFFHIKNSVKFLAFSSRFLLIIFKLNING